MPTALRGRERLRCMEGQRWLNAENTNLPIGGVLKNTNREIGVPGESP